MKLSYVAAVIAGLVTYAGICGTSEAAWVAVQSIPADDGFTSAAGCNRATVPLAGDNNANNRVAGHSYFNLAPYHGISDVASMRFRFRVITTDGNPFVDLGPLSVSIHVGNTICVPPLGITFLTNVFADGAYVIGPAHPNYWNLHMVVEYALFTGQDIIVNYNFPASDVDGMDDIAILPSNLSILEMDIY